MFNIGFAELALILGLALILIGPDQLPAIARAVGRFLNDIKRSSDEFTSEFKAADKKISDEIKGKPSNES